MVTGVMKKRKKLKVTISKIGANLARPRGLGINELMSRKAYRDGSDDAYEDMAIRMYQRWQHRKTKRTVLVLHGPQDGGDASPSTVMYRYEKPIKKSTFVSTCSLHVDRFRQAFDKIS
jgi:hypothetical protein